MIVTPLWAARPEDRFEIACDQLCQGLKAASKAVKDFASAYVATTKVIEENQWLNAHR